MSEKIVKSKTGKIREINITKKFTDKESEHHITVQIRYSTYSLDDLKKAMNGMETSMTNSNRSNPGIF